MTTTTFTVTPLSEFRPKHSLGEFLGQLRYSGRGARDKFTADHLLIDGLNRELVRKAQVGSLGTVGELDEGRIQACVEYVEDRFANWRLGGEESESVLARLDHHFEAEQKLWGSSAQRLRSFRQRGLGTFPRRWPP